MTKRALSTIGAFLGLCRCLSAQQPQSFEQTGFDGSPLGRPYPALTSLGLEERERFFFSTAFGSMRPTMGFLSPSYSMHSREATIPAMSDRRNSSDDAVELRPIDRIYTGGEIGVLYGKSAGKYGREDFETYIVGTVGNEHFSITAGASYERSTGRVPYWIRR